MEKEESITKYEIRQTDLKKELTKLKKKVPYSIIVFVCFGIALVMLIEGKLYKYIGGNYNIIFVISVFLVSIVSIYMLTITFKINKLNKEIKSLGEKMYNKMKLHDLKDE